jgi:hypothetical protein
MPSGTLKLGNPKFQDSIADWPLLMPFSTCKQHPDSLTEETVQLPGVPSKDDLETCWKNAQSITETCWGCTDGISGISCVRGYQVGAWLAKIQEFASKSRSNKRQVAEAFNIDRQEDLDEQTSKPQPSPIFNKDGSLHHSTARRCVRLFKFAQQYPQIVFVRGTSMNMICSQLSELQKVLTHMKDSECYTETIRFLAGTLEFENEVSFAKHSSLAHSLMQQAVREVCNVSDDIAEGPTKRKTKQKQRPSKKKMRKQKSLNSKQKTKQNTRDKITNNNNNNNNNNKNNNNDNNNDNNDDNNADNNRKNKTTKFFSWCSPQCLGCPHKLQSEAPPAGAGSLQKGIQQNSGGFDFDWKKPGEMTDQCAASFLQDNLTEWVKGAGLGGSYTVALLPAE